MDDITGLVSFLNREKDSRTFAHAVFKRIEVEMSLDEANKLADTLFDSQVALEQLQDQLRSECTKKNSSSSCKNTRETIAETKKTIASIKKEQQKAKSNNINSQQCAIQECIANAKRKLK